MYSFTRVLMGLKLARMLIQVSVVVSTTSTRRDAVHADLVLDAEGGDPGRPSRSYWKPGRRSDGTAAPSTQ